MLIASMNLLDYALPTICYFIKCIIWVDTYNPLYNHAAVP